MIKTRINYYSLIRTLHVYFGLFISPFVLIFSISVLAFNHANLLNNISPVKPFPETEAMLDSIPFDTTDLLTAKAIIHKIGVKGEIDYININKDKITFPVITPGHKDFVMVNRHTGSVVVSSQLEGSIRAMNYLHIMPGQHNAKIRGNSFYLKIWKVIADLVVYLILFLILSGIYLWYLLEFERSAGFFAIVSGMLLFIGLLILIF